LSSDDDAPNRRQFRPAGIEQRPGPVDLEVAEPEADPLDPLDQVVEDLGGSVAHPGQVVVAELVEPSDRASESLDIGGHGPPEAMTLELVEQLAGLVGVTCGIEGRCCIGGSSGAGTLVARCSRRYPFMR